MWTTMAKRTPWRMALAMLTAGAVLAGCPYPIDPGDGWDQAEYDLGFTAGFLEDAEYWQGFDDSYDTRDAGPIYYTGSEIPVLEDPPYDAGYWDGVWYAYNDGYFVAYDYAFTIGFSEGYDLAFGPGWPALLASDEHLEYLDGGWSDGYNDGFSEGRVFGAWDYESGWSYDWLGAMLDYRDGTDLEIGGVATGNDGPVFLYEYGTDPMDLLKRAPALRDRAGRGVLGIRGLDAKAEAPALSYRDLTAEVRTAFGVSPATSPRSTAPLNLKSTWLDRVNAYRDALGGKAAHATRK